jgi:hypothetical protein
LRHNLAVREKLEVVEVRSEKHSAKAAGRRPVFQQLLTDIREGKFNGILTWAPDRLSRNGGDLGHPAGDLGGMRFGVRLPPRAKKHHFCAGK